MLKTLIFGFLLGIVGTVAAAYYVPVVDQYRESSVISVSPNGGTFWFHASVLEGVRCLNRLFSTLTPGRRSTYRSP